MALQATPAMAGPGAGIPANLNQQVLAQTYQVGDSCQR